MAGIDHNINGAFARAAHDATADGQTETVYAMRVDYDGKDTEYWNVSVEPYTPERLRQSRDSAFQWGRRDGTPVTGFTQVSRTVTITATAWTADKN